MFRIRGVQRGQNKFRRGPKVQSGWAIITRPSQDNLATSIIIANSVVTTTRPSQENIATSITIANSLVIITSLTGKELSLAFSDWYKTWHVSRVLPLCLQTGHTQRVWPSSSSLPLPHFYYVFVIRLFAFFLVPSPLQELSNNNSLLRYFILVLINKSAILRGQNLSQQLLVWFLFLVPL